MGSNGEIEIDNAKDCLDWVILAQLRHIFFHVGYLHCCIKMEKGETPEYIGLYKAVQEK